MLIAVISDTHDVYPDQLTPRLSHADEIWHLGDVTTPEVLRSIESLDIPLRVVVGNCDAPQHSWPYSLNLSIEGLRCHLVHIPPTSYPPDTQIILHGHTHIPRDHTDPLGCRWLNPGSVSFPRGGSEASYGMLKLKKGKLLSWKILAV